MGGFHLPGHALAGGVSGSAPRLVGWGSPPACTARIPNNVQPRVMRDHGDGFPTSDPSWHKWKGGHFSLAHHQSASLASPRTHAEVYLVPPSVRELPLPVVFSLPPVPVLCPSITFLRSPLCHGRGASAGDSGAGARRARQADHDQRREPAVESDF